MTWAPGRKNPWIIWITAKPLAIVLPGTWPLMASRLWDGVGISIAANQVHGVRAAVAHNVDTARLVREHNDANVLALGGRVVNGPLGIEMVQIFLKTEFLGGRHPRRVEKISRIETKKQR